LIVAGLHQYGLKPDLVSRLREHYRKNPDQIPSSATQTVSIRCGSSREVGSVAEGSSIPAAVPSPWLPGHSPLKSGLGSQSAEFGAFGGPGTNDLGGGLIRGSDGNYYKDGLWVPVPNLGTGALETSVNSSINSEEFGDEDVKNVKQKLVEIDKERIMKKIGEIKSNEKAGIEFFTNGLSIRITEDLTVGAMERKIITVKMAELDLFASEMAGRRLLVKERANSRRMLTVYKQIVTCSVNERKSQVEVLVENMRSRPVTIKASEKFKLIRVHVEKKIEDLDHQFDVPEDDDFIEEVENYLEKEVVDAVTTNDIVLKPKSYHTELCKAKVDNSKYPENEDILVQCERTKASTMRIGMRKMILVPKLLTYMRLGDSHAEVSVRLYNSSNSIMRISAKTPIAGLRFGKPGIVSEEELKVTTDRRRRFGTVTERYNQLTEGQVVLLSCSERGKAGRKPTIVKLTLKDKMISVPLGPELGGVRDDFKLQRLLDKSSS